MLMGDHYNFKIPSVSEPDKIIETDSENESLIYPPVSPGDALSMAENYVSFPWSAENFNITDGVETDPQGVMIQTPEWVQEGDNYHIPYKWGGFNTLDGFSSGLLEMNETTCCKLLYAVLLFNPQSRLTNYFPNTTNWCLRETLAKFI